MTGGGTDRSPRRSDVVVVGGGAAGLSAALFCARYGLETLVFDRGTSAIRQAYVVENYLGLPAVTPAEFLAVGRAQVEATGATVVEEQVTAVTANDDSTADGVPRFRVETTEDRTVTADHVVAASAYDGTYLPETVDPTDTDDAGRTDCEGLSIAGWLTEGPHQVVACAGHGAQVAKGVVVDRRRADGWWAAVADYWDWSVPDGQYGDDRWHEEVDAWLADTRPAGISDEHFERVCEEIKRERLGFETTAEERRNRVTAGQSTLHEHLDWPDGDG